MKMLTVILILSCLASAQPSSFTGQELNEWLKGYDRMQARTASDQDAGQYMYALGFIQGVTAALIISHQACPTQVVSGGASAQIMRNYLSAHPEQWQKHASVLVSSAIKEAYPCGSAK